MKRSTRGGIVRGRSAAAVVILALAACAGPGTVPVRGGAGQASGTAPGAGALPRLEPAPKPANLGMVERFAWQTVEQLGDALAAGEGAAFLNKVSNGFYKGYARLDAALNDLLAATAARTVVVAVREVALDGERVSVRAAWTRSFRMPSGETSEAAGETTFIFLKSDTALRLLDYRGDPPFGIPGI